MRVARITTQRLCGVPVAQVSRFRTAILKMKEEGRKLVGTKRAGKAENRSGQVGRPSSAEEIVQKQGVERFFLPLFSASFLRIENCWLQEQTHGK